MAKYDHGGGCPCGLLPECDNKCNIALEQQYISALMASKNILQDNIIKKVVTDTRSPDTNVEAIRESLLQRSIVGLKKYNTTTNRTDLTMGDWLQHLQEELLDAAVYVERLKSMVRSLEAVFGPVKK